MDVFVSGQEFYRFINGEAYICKLHPTHNECFRIKYVPKTHIFHYKDESFAVYEPVSIVETA